MIELCPRCQKYTNTNAHVLPSKEGINTTYFCEECGMTIRNVVDKYPNRVDENDNDVK